MKQVYCDNGSTSFPKAPGLGAAIGNHIDNNGYNISRGGYTGAYAVEEAVIETRELLCELFNYPNIKNVIFTPGATTGLNMVLKGFLKPKDHVITTSMEHNAVVRPLAQLVTEGVEWDEALCNSQGELSVEAVSRLIKPNTKLLMITHGSNVCGTVTPIDEIGMLCVKSGIAFAVDGAQTAGSIPIDMEKSKIDALIFPGHKSLLGPQGIGGIILRSGFGEKIMPLVAGGTGSLSDKEDMPEFLPDKFQPGTLNIPGIIGMKHSLEFIKKEGLSAIKEKKGALTARFIDGVKNIDNIRLVGKEGTEGRCAVVSLDFKTIDNAEAAFTLESQYGIMTRCGLHCAPHAHKTLGTFPQGTVRFSFGYFNTPEEVDYVIEALNNIICGLHFANAQS